MSQLGFFMSLNTNYWSYLHELLICGYIRRIEKKYEFSMIIPMEISIIIIQSNDKLFECRNSIKNSTTFTKSIPFTIFKQQSNRASISSIFSTNFSKKIITISSDYYFAITRNIWKSSKLTIDKHKLCDSNISSKISNKNLCFEITKHGLYIFTAGFTDNSFKIWDINKSKIIKSIKYHNDIVSCLCIDDNTLITGSYDKSIVIWVIEYISNNEHKHSLDINKSIQILEEAEVISVDLSLNSGIFACVLLNGTVNIYDSSTMQKISKLQPHHDSRYQINDFIVSVSKIFGHIIYYSKQTKYLFLFSSSGLLINSSISDNDMYNDIIFSKCCKYIVCGGQNGQIRIKQIPSLKTLKTLKTSTIKRKSITKLYLQEDEHCIVAGSQDGQITIYRRKWTLDELGF